VPFVARAAKPSDMNRTPERSVRYSAALPRPWNVISLDLRKASVERSITQLFGRRQMMCSA
jgi:hypothetical protein